MEWKTMDKFVNWDATFAADPMNYFWFMIVLLGIGEFVVDVLDGLHRALSWMLSIVEKHY